MSPLETFLVSRFIIFTLVLARISGLMLSAPVFNSLGLPRQVRAFLAVAISLLVAPVYFGTSLPPVSDLTTYARLMANETLVGLLLGLGVSILFAGVQVAGQIVSQISGVSLADVFNPGFDESISVFSHLFYLVTLAVFVAIGGHRELMAAVLDTFAKAPPGHAMLGDSFVEVLTNLMSQSFALGVQASAPILIALSLATLVLGLVSRTLPQLNVLVVGFGLNSLLTIAMTLFSLGAIAWTFQGPIIGAISDVLQSLPM